MNGIMYFLKFGQKKYLSGICNRQLYFNNAITLRGIEEKTKLKGQGDQLEGSARVYATNMSMFNEDGTVAMQGIRGNVLLHFEPANKIPVYCLFAVMEKDCVVDKDGNRHIHLDPDIKTTIQEHFPKADAVAVITDPEQFVREVTESLNCDCKSGMVHYFNIDKGLEVSGTAIRAMDMEYMRYLVQDVESEVKGNKKSWSFKAEYVYRALFCKDVFFMNEQEFRFVLPKESIETGTTYSVEFTEQPTIMDLDDFMSNC